MLRDVAAAVVEVEAGRPVDLHRLRARVTAVADQLRAGVDDRRMGRSGRGAAEHLAITTEALLRVLDLLGAGDVPGARQAVRDALWAPSGRLAPGCRRLRPARPIRPG